MSADAEIRERAELFGWTISHSLQFHDTIVRGDQMIDIVYRGDGAVSVGHRYRFFSLNNLQYRDSTPEKYKKQTIFSWLAEGA